MPAFDAPPQTGPGKGTSLHGNDQQVTERRTLRDYLVILRERLWIALPVALLVAISLGYYQARETPMYSSVATMQFEPNPVTCSLSLLNFNRDAFRPQICSSPARKVTRLHCC